MNIMSGAVILAVGLVLSSPAFAQVTFRIIVVSTPDAAQRVAAQVAAGVNVVALAQAESIDPSAADGGLIGPIALASLRPELRDALAPLAVGGVSPVVRVPLGYAVLQRIQPTLSLPPLSVSEFPALASTGAVRPTLSVDGFSEAETVLANHTKPPDWNQDPQTICQIRKASIARNIDSLARALSPTSELYKIAEPLEIVEAHISFGNLFAYDGRMRETIDQFEKALAAAEARYPAAIPQLLEMLGIAHLHQAEIDNGILHTPGTRCLLSGRPSEPVAATADSEKAVAYFRRYLDATPDDLEVKWLLNVTHMLTGGYPARVPARFLIPASAFESAEDVGRFVDVAPTLGLDTVASAGGIIVDDFDNDGRFDIVSSNSNSCGPMQAFHRAADGTFADRAKAFDGQLGGLNLVQTDYNNDGCRDVYVLRGGWVLPQRNSLLRNNCDGTFTDVTAASGLAVPATSTQTAVWTDIDNDGFVDLFVGNEDTPAQLFHNRGDGTFEDIAEAAGVGRTAFTKGVNAADFDNDGFVDLYVSNLAGGNFLYRNNGNRRFTETSSGAGVATTDRGFATWFFDYDNDGFDDLFVTSYYQSVEESAKTYLRLPFNANGMKLYRNNRNGTFRDVSRDVGLDKVYMPMGVNFGDIDNDGFLDMYLGTGSPSYGALVPSVLLRNRDGKSFVDVTTSSGTGELHKGHGVAFADLDNDGDQEILFEVGGATPGDAHAFRLFENPGHGNDWLGLRLVGVKTNRAAIGARITVTVEDDRGARRSMHRTVTSGGSFGASPLQQHVGLGRGAKTVDVEIYWPVSRTRQRFTNVSKNQVIEIRELADRFEALNRPPMPLRR